MSTQTTNLQLVKPTVDEFYDINIVNGNMDKIDVEVAAKETPAGAQAKVDAHAAADDPHTGYIKKSLATAANDFLVASGAGAFVKKTLAEVKTILGLGTAAYTNSTAYATAEQGTKADNAATQASVDAHLAEFATVKAKTYTNYNMTVTATDTNGKPIQTQYKREDATLYLQVDASNADANGYYQTIAERYYDIDGVTLLNTVTWTLVY
ncbi:MAG: hypothetical protein K0S75_2384, partial [Clostridia bacterium]|nr:hypothetical protein [Clostridia bacterium]